MKKILIQFAHPAQTRSKINKALRKSVESIEHITLNDLYYHYPDFHIDVSREQALCEEHDIIIFQHPFYWYSTPAIIKEWLDLVLQHGWAYGKTGTALKDKLFLQALSGGGDASTYQKDGYNEFTIRELTSPFQATAKLCHMIWLPPFTVLGVHRGLEQSTVEQYANDYQRTVLALRDERLDLASAYEHEYLNSQLNALIKDA